MNFGVVVVVVFELHVVFVVDHVVVVCVVFKLHIVSVVDHVVVVVVVADHAAVV